MKNRSFKPIHPAQAWEERLRKIIEQRLLDVFYKPLVRASGYHIRGIHNADRSPLAQALVTGDVVYYDGKFSGRYNASISKQLVTLGATYERATKSWVLPETMLDFETRQAIHAYNQRMEKLTGNVLDFLRNDDAIIAEFQKDDYVADLVATAEGTERSIKSASKSIGIDWEFNPITRENIAYAYSENLNLFIKKWTSENIIKLRKEVEQHAAQGYRAKDLADIIRENYGVGRSKAKFLARQETSLLVSKYQADKYQQHGIQRYKWSTSHDNRVRHDHRLLDGKVFSWDNPPVVDELTGRRANPGEDFNCRCVAIPILEDD